MKSQNKIAFAFFFIILLVGQASASILEEHTSQIEIALEETSSSPITQSILPYQDYYALCNELTDISVVYYFTIDTTEEDSFLDKLFKIFTFDIGKQYRATHARSACQRALQVAGADPQLQACGYGICSHLVQDAVSHNNAVPGAIMKTKLYNGVIHSIKEIHDKNLFTNAQDWKYSRDVLKLAYCDETHSQEGCKIVDYFEDVFVNDPALSSVNIPAVVSFFLGQTVDDVGYSLGFKAFFALPQYIYWAILVFFLTSVAMLGLSVRKIRDGQRDLSTVFIASIFFFIFAIVGTAIYGLFSGNIWSIWESLSQYIFSPALYLFGGAFVLIGGVLIFQFVTKPNKKERIGDLAVAMFLLLVGSYMLTLPTGLILGNEQQLREQSINGVKGLLNNGVVYINTIQDPVGYDALKDANAFGSGARTTFLISLLALLSIIIFTAFRRRK